MPMMMHGGGRGMMRRRHMMGGGPPGGNPWWSGCPMAGYGHMGPHRRFYSEEEEKEMLEDYLHDLENEIKAVKHALDDLGTGGLE